MAQRRKSLESTLVANAKLWLKYASFLTMLSSDLLQQRVRGREESRVINLSMILSELQVSTAHFDYQDTRRNAFELF